MPMAQRRQRGWLKKEARSQGQTWVLFFRAIRKSDGKRVENKVPIGLVQDFPDRNSAWAEIERLHLQINPVDSRRGVTVGDLALHYAEHELVERTESIHPKAHTTVKGYERVLRNRSLPRWGNRIALGIEPLEVEQWLKTLKLEDELANPTLDRMRRVMSLVYRHCQRYSLIPRKAGVEPNAVRPLQNNQRLRSHDPNSRTGVCSLPKPARPRTYADAFGCRHGSSHIGVPRLAMARRELRGRNDPCASYLDVWSSRSAEEQSF